MLHTILLILKIIGIALLCILGLILFLILLVLFVPIRYRASGDKSEKELRVSVKVTYLLHILSVRFEYPDPGSVCVRIFGIRVFDLSPLKDGKETPQKEKKKAQKKNEKAPAAGDAGGEAKEKDLVAAEASEASKECETPADDGRQEGSDAENAREKADKEKTDGGEKRSLVRHPIRFIKEKIERILYTIREICDKIKHIADTIQYYREVVTAPANIRFYKRVWQRVFKILKSIRPRVLRAELVAGTGSPDTTGYVCALYGMLLPILGEHVDLTPDFEEKRFQGNFLIKGRITVFTILIQVLKVVLDKQLRILIKQLKREDA